MTAVQHQYGALQESRRPTQEKVDLAVKTAIEVAHPSSVFLFGSWPRGEAADDSDLDLAVFVSDDRAGETRELWNKLRDRLRDIPMGIDLIIAPEGLVADFMSSVNSVYYKIVHGGTLVYGSRIERAQREGVAVIDKQAQLLLKKAAGDEAVILIPGVPDGPFGFHVQQAIEKLLKALLSQLGIEYQRTHDLNELLSQLKIAGETLLPPVAEHSQIQKFAVTHRYDEIPEPLALERSQAIETVRVLREHVVSRIAALAKTR